MCDIRPATVARRQVLLELTKEFGHNYRAAANAAVERGLYGKNVNRGDIELRLLRVRQLESRKNRRIVPAPLYASFEAWSKYHHNNLETDLSALRVEVKYLKWLLKESE